MPLAAQQRPPAAITAPRDDYLPPFIARQQGIGKDTSRQASAATAPEGVQKPNAGLSFGTIAIAMVVGFLVALLRLVAHFYKFAGVGMLTNRSSLFFIASLTVLAGCSPMLAAPSTKMIGLAGAVDSDMLNAFLGMFGFPLAANFTTILGRLAARKSGAGAPSGVKDLDAVVSANVIFEFVRYSIAERLDAEVARMAHSYSWEQLRDVSARLIATETTTGSLTQADGDAVIDFIGKFQPDADAKVDESNKYKALHRVIKVTSFSQLRSRLQAQKLAA